MVTQGCQLMSFARGMHAASTTALLRGTCKGWGTTAVATFMVSVISPNQCMCCPCTQQKRGIHTTAYLQLVSERWPPARQHDGVGNVCGPDAEQCPLLLLRQLCRRHCLHSHDLFHAPPVTSSALLSTLDDPDVRCPDVLSLRLVGSTWCASKWRPDACMADCWASSSALSSHSRRTAIWSGNVKAHLDPLPVPCSAVQGVPCLAGLADGNDTGGADVFGRHAVFV